MIVRFEFSKVALWEVVDGTAPLCSSGKKVDKIMLGSTTITV